MNERDYIYYVDKPDGSYYCHYRLNDVLHIYERLDGTRIYAKSKDWDNTVITIVDKPNIDIERIRTDWTMKITTKAQRKAIEKYDDRTAKRFCLKLNKETDQDIIAYLESAENKQGLIKQLIRNEINKKYN